MLKEFKEFAVKGNVLDLAIGVVIGGAFGKIVSSFVSDLLMPPIGLMLGKVDFSNLYLNLSGGSYPSLDVAKKAGAVTVNFGLFINQFIDFTIVAFSVFLLVKGVNRLKQAPQVSTVSATHKTCPFCISSIPLAASRCAFCTSELPRS